MTLISKAQPLPGQSDEIPCRGEAMKLCAGVLAMAALLLVALPAQGDYRAHEL